MLDWLLCAFVRAVGWLVCRLSPEASVSLGMALGEVGYWLQPKRVRVGRQNLKAAYGDRLSPSQMDRILHGVFRELGAGVVEMLRLPVMDHAYEKRYIEMPGEEHIKQALADGRPVIFLTAHFGNWELSAIVGALKGYVITSLARVQKRFPRLYLMLIASRESKGCRVVHKGSAVRQLVRALERGECAGIVGDQASRQGVWVDFFGRPAQFATGPFELARSRGAVILPLFTHRRRGPHHRIVVEPPIQSVEQFARMLQRHIDEEPAQWLWLHKRWKRTPHRRVLVLSDGKLGHVKQSLVVAEALKSHSPHVQEQTLEVRYRNRLARVLALAWAWLMPFGLGARVCLRMALAPASYRRLSTAYADVIVSCGAAAAPINVLLARENRAKSVVIMNPAPLPLRRFDLAFVPRHDRVPQRRNIIRTTGALTSITDAQLAEASRRLLAEHRLSSNAARPGIAVLLGGDTDAYEFTTAFAESLISQVLAACEEWNAVCMVTTSRRTPSNVERLLNERLDRHPRCELLLLASRDQLNGTLEGMVGWAQIVVVTGESISMVSEACASGRHVVVVEPPLRRASHGAPSKHRAYLRDLAQEGYIQLQVLPQLGHALRQALTQRPASRRLDMTATVREAVARVL